MREQMLEFAECMRDHGIDMPDPVFADDGRVADPGERPVGRRRPAGTTTTSRPPQEECSRTRLVFGPMAPGAAACPDGRGRLTVRGWWLLDRRGRRRGRRRRRRRGRLPSERSDEPPADDRRATEAELATVDVVRRDLARVEELDGTVGHGDATPLVLDRPGHAHRAARAGDVIEPGDVVAEVDGLPIIALQGAFPLWRALGPGVDDGKDVLQLEYMLASLGYAEEHDVTVDEDWTSATTDAVEAFQEDHGQDDDGEIDLGEIVFIDGPVLRRRRRPASLGQPASEAGISVTADRAVGPRRPRRGRRRPARRRRRGRGRAAHRRDGDGDGHRRSGRRETDEATGAIDASRSRSR